MLSLTPLALHSLHSICSGGSQLQGELDVCMCQQEGEDFGERSDRTRGCLIFELVVHMALRVHHFVSIALVRGKSFDWGVSALFLAPGFPRFPSTSSMTASSVTSVFEESCFGF